MSVVTARKQVTHDDGVLVMKRVFGASCEQVFEAWTRPEQFSRWFGPQGASMPHCRIDAREGGELHFRMCVPGDVDVWCKGFFHEVERPGRIVFSSHFSNERGELVERPGVSFETVIDVTFAPHPRGTEITVRQEGLLVDQGEIQGWTDGFDRLDALLETLPASREGETR